MKTKINNHIVKEILRLLEWKGVDIHYNLFNEKKFINDPRFGSILNK